MLVLFFFLFSRIALFHSAWFCTNASNFYCKSLICFISSLKSFKALVAKLATMAWTFLQRNVCVSAVDLIKIGNLTFTISSIFPSWTPTIWHNSMIRVGDHKPLDVWTPPVWHCRSWYFCSALWPSTIELFLLGHSRYDMMASVSSIPAWINSGT